MFNPNVNLPNVNGFLFDIDGTLANTDPIHFNVFQELLLKEPSVNHGKPIDHEFFRFHYFYRSYQY